MDTKKEAKKYLNKYFKAQYLNETDDEYKELVRLLNKALSLGGVICRLSTDCLAEPLEFDGEPLYYKIDGIYGYITPINNKVFFIYSDADGGLYYDELENWKVLNGI